MNTGHINWGVTRHFLLFVFLALSHEARAKPAARSRVHFVHEPAIRVRGIWSLRSGLSISDRALALLVVLVNGLLVNHGKLRLAFRGHQLFCS